MHSLVPLARKNRKQQTDAENILWVYIRKKQLLGVHFRRQMPIGKYIVDFVSREQKLIIELDGGQHNEDTARQYDAERTACFERLGYRVIRVWNNEIFHNLNGVLEALCERLSTSPLPSPLRPEREQKKEKMTNKKTSATI